MDIDSDKLIALAKTLTDDQRQLLREGLAEGGDLDPETLAESLRSLDTEAVFARLAADTSPLDASPLKFKKNRPLPKPGVTGEPVILNLKRAPATLEAVARLAQKRSGREVTDVTEVRVLDLDPSEADDETLKRLGEQELTKKTATARRLIRLDQPQMSTSIGDLAGLQDRSTGVAAAARRVVVVIIIDGIIIVVVFPPTNPTPPPEPPLTRW